MDPLALIEDYLSDQENGMINAKRSMVLFLLCPNLGWIQGQFNFTELSLRYQENRKTICCQAGPENRS